MIFINKINDLKLSYDDSRIGIRDCAILLDKFENTPPLSKHMIFLPMPHELMESLIKSYKLDFPKELLTLYKYMNGANLFWDSRIVGKNKIRIPIKYLSIYGVPLTYDRKHIEPYNISIEDLDRPKHTPNSWLKFGHYSLPDSNTQRFDLFVDTDSGCVYAVENKIKDCIITKNWNSIDEALCYIYDLLDSFRLSTNDTSNAKYK